MAAPAREHDALNGGPTNQAWFAFASVYAMLKLEETFFAVRVYVVRDRRTTQGDGLAQDFLHRPVQPVQVGAGQRSSLATWANAGAKQRFVGVDIADAPQQLLVQEGTLDRSLATAKQFYEVLLRHFKRFQSAGVKARRVDAQLAEHSRIDKPKFVTRSKLRDQVSVFDHFRRRFANHHAACH